MKSHFLLIGAFTALATTTSFAQAPRVEFKGTPMGASMAELKSKLDLPDLGCSVFEVNTKSCYIPRPPFTYAGQMVITFSADFTDDRLTRVTVQTLGGSAGIIRQSIEAKYGRPKSQRKVAKSLDNGIKYQMTATEWKLASGDEIVIEDHPQPVGQVFVGIDSREFLAWRKKANKAGAKEKRDI